MIYVDIKGNLGNQMFIYSFARKVQIITNKKINLSYYNLKKYFNMNDEIIKLFKLNSNVEFSNKKMPWIINSNIFIRKAINIVFNNTRLLRILKKIQYNILIKFGVIYWDLEDYKEIDYEKLKKFKNIYIIGYWQSPLYFDDIKDILVKELTLKEKISKKNKKLLDTIKSNNSICLSIRRGDYITNKRNKKKYYLCDINYFKKAVEQITNKYSDCMICCFSNDIQWVKENMKFPIKTYYESEDNSLSDTINLMQGCSIFVLSNSSFSWWAQYLSQNNKYVIAPSRWYTNGTGKDIYQDNWETINVGKDLNK